MSNIKLEKRITVGGINGTRKGFKDVKERTTLARVVGIVRTLKVSESESGVLLLFAGDFRAWNAEGSAFQAPTLVLPAPAARILEGAVESDANGHGVEFGFDLIAVPAKNSLGYTWAVETLVPLSPFDPLASILAKIGAPDVLDDDNTGAQEDVKEGVHNTGHGDIDPSTKINDDTRGPALKSVKKK